jgi:Arylsulfotransferase (ASST)
MRSMGPAVGALGSARASLTVIAATVVVALLALTDEAANALSMSPLNGTPDASLQTQISFVGAPAGDIKDISVIGSRSGRHVGRLEAYASAPGASFVVATPFAPGEYVRASAVVAESAGHSTRVSSSFTIAHPASYPHTPMEPPPKAKPGAVQSFVSQPGLQPPTVQVNVASPLAEAGDVLISPNHGAGQWGPMIIDSMGQLVWFQPVTPGNTAMNLELERYQGQPVLVWWQGYLSRLGIGLGTDEIYNSSYQLVAQITGGNGYAADLHDLQITPQGSAFITPFSFVHADLSSAGGSRDGILLDSIVQEIDIKTGLVMFEWHAYGHVPVSDSYTTPGSGPCCWDYFHTNSISLDPWNDGNFIISARNTWAAYEISYHTGAILWRLGGRRPTFRMGSGTGVAWQHDVRWQADRTLTMFDDGSAPKVHSQSREIRVRIDWSHRTVTLVDRDVHTPALLSGSQGDAETLPDGDVFVGWGEEPYFTEFSSTGQVVFDARLPAPGQSYRAYRMPWRATPAASPSVAVQATGPGTLTIYASWNGATDVRSWRVLGGEGSGALTSLVTLARTGFETAIPVSSAQQWFAVQALGSAGQVLGTSSPAHA